MTKKLYCVRVVLYVMAENASGACVAATTAPFDIFECRARKADRIHAGWEDSIPYNADDERTCAQVLAAEKLAAHPVVPLAASGGHKDATLRVPLYRSIAVRPSAR